MVEELLIGLTLAAVAAVTGLAYRHPRDYPRVGAALFVVPSLGMIWVLGWNYGVGSALETCRAESCSLDLMLKIGEQSFTHTALLVWICSTAYLGLLLALPRLFPSIDRERPGG